jgi:hypothetical protein
MMMMMMRRMRMRRSRRDRRNYISFYLKYPHSSDGFLATIFKENILRFLPTQTNYTDSSEKM